MKKMMASSRFIVVATMLAVCSCVPKNNRFTPAERVDLILKSDLVLKTFYMDSERVRELVPFDAMFFPGKERPTGKIEYVVTFKVRDIVKGEYNQPTLRVVVESPVMAFGVIDPWSQGEKAYTFYMKHYPEGSGYYQVLGAEW